MREIKFSGKRVDNGEWVEGNFVKDPTGQCRIYWQPFDEANSNTYHRVTPETVSQYVGLKDKNGKEIFENDIIKSSNNIIGQVYFDEINLQYLHKNKDGGFRFYNGQIEDEMPIYREYEVIGDIFDNPELLEVSDDNLSN